MRIFRLIHGIHSPEGNNNMSALHPVLQKAAPKAHVVLFEYGFMGFWKARWANDRVARNLAAVCTPGEVWITHSNGAAVAYLATHQYGAEPAMIVNINPALDRDLAAKCPLIETIHSDGDRAVYWSQFLPFHLWGDQGKVGYRGNARHVINHNASRIGGRMAYKGHMDLFDSVRIRDWSFFIANRIGERLGAPLC